MTLFADMVLGYHAELRTQTEIEFVLGIELEGIQFDDYDLSIEIYPDEHAPDFLVTAHQTEKILQLGCKKFWVNFANGVELSHTGEVRMPSTNRWKSFTQSVVLNRPREPRVDRHAGLFAADLVALLMKLAPHVGAVGTTASEVLTALDEVVKAKEAPPAL